MGNIKVKPRCSVSLINENPTEYCYRVVYFDSWDTVTSKEFLMRLDLEIDQGYPMWIQPYYINDHGDREERKEIVIKPHTDGEYRLNGDILTEG
jgi:hypothetical protein